jgi:serine/threonine protein kinase
VGSSAVIIQESVRGRVHLCLTWVGVGVGRDADVCALVVKDQHVSRKHCELFAEMDGRLRVKDLSSQGTFVRGERLPPNVEAHVVAGETIRLGEAATLTHLGVIDPLAPTRDAQGWLTLPQRLPPQYLLLRAVGHGGAGIVYEAWDEKLKKRVAIKLLIAGGRATTELVERFKREAMLQGKLKDYPGIVRVYDLGTVPDSGELFFSMEFVAGGTLRQRIKDGLPRIDGLRLMARVCRAVHYAHENGVVHRDLKPGNIMVSERGVIRLTDFGVCKALEDQEGGLTLTGVMMGTPNYMAPEQIEDAKRVGPLADVYGLGAILYHVLTGRPPFVGDDLTRMLDQVASGDLAAPSTFDPQIPAELDQLVLRAMSVQEDRRPPSAMAVAEILEAWLKRNAPADKVTLSLPRVDASGERLPAGPPPTVEVRAFDDPGDDPTSTP